MLIAQIIIAGMLLFVFFPDMKRRFIVKCMVEIRDVIELTSSKHVTT